MSFTIYALKLIDDPEVRYVGLTGREPEIRLSRLTLEARLYGRRPTDGFGGWLLDNEGGIECAHLDYATTKSDAHALERDMVRLFLGLDHRLFNSWLVPRGKRQPLSDADARVAARIHGEQ
jgi:hypothetical protein